MAFLIRKLCLSSVFFLFALQVPCALAQEKKDDDEKREEDNKKHLEELVRKAEEEYRLYFKKPQKVHEFWGAMKFEINTGKFELAALHLKLLHKLFLDADMLPDPEKEKKLLELEKGLLDLEEALGMSAFFHLEKISKWSNNPTFNKEAQDNVESLIDRVTKAVDKHFSDPRKLEKWIKNLDAPTIEERAYAFVQLHRAGERAVPMLVQTLQDNVDKPMQHIVREAMIKLKSEIVPPLLEILKARVDPDGKTHEEKYRDHLTPNLRLDILEIVRRRADKRATPYLWHLSSSNHYPLLVRNKARETLGVLLQKSPDNLPPAKQVLVDMAERFYQHKVKFPPGKPLQIWWWDGNKIDPKPIPLKPSQAEEFFGKRYAMEALELDSSYRPAQMVYFNLTLDREYQRSIDKILLEPALPNMQQLLATLEIDFLLQVLERALDDRKFTIALPVILALGERGELKAVRGNESRPQGLLRALYYPDRRVQQAAARAMVRIPAATAQGAKVPEAYKLYGPITTARIVEVLRRNLAAQPEPRALVIYPGPQPAEIRQKIKEAGFDAVLAKNDREAFLHLKQAADVDAILIPPGAPLLEMPYLLSQLRADVDAGMLPILLFTPKEGQEKLINMAAKHRNVWVMPDTLLQLPEELKNAIADQIRDASGALLSPEERKNFTQISMNNLWNMALGQLPGYDVKPAQDAVFDALRSPDLNLQAVEILGRLPGGPVQQKLASIVLDPAQDKVRIPAVMELKRHVQKNGVLLTKLQIHDLKLALNNSGENPRLRAELALVIGSLGSTPRQTGVQLFQFKPDDPPQEKKEKGN